MIPTRILPYARGDGPTNMAIDEALLDAVASQPDASVVRTYSWSVPTLSLGYFQPYAEVDADGRWSGVPVVRRATGGGALWHDREVTYAVVIPGSHPLARPSTALYRAIHAAIGGKIRELGIAAARRGDDPPAAEAGSSRPFLCFGDHDADDIVAGRDKLVGSAQRRRSGAVLQHGSLLLERSPVTPELSGLIEVAASSRFDRGSDWPMGDPTAWSSILAEALPNVLGGEIFRQDLTSEERRQADTLRRRVYANPEWTRRR